MENNQNTATRKWYKTWWARTAIFLLVLGLSFMVAIIFIVVDALNNVENEGFPKVGKSPEISKDFLSLLQAPTNYFKGPKNAEVVLVEFGDFACPSCKSLYPKLENISNKYPNIKIVFRDLPVISSFSSDLAMAARCAGEQELFWQMHDALFDNQALIYQEKDDLILTLADIAVKTGVEINRFAICMNEKKYLAHIQKDYADSVTLEQFGVELKGTPTMFINGHMIEGDIPENVLDKIVSEIIKNNYTK